MKRKLTLLLTAFLLLSGMKSWGQVRTEITDHLDREFTGVTGTTYSSWEGKTSLSDAVYAGQSAGGNESIQLRSNNSNSGIITTSSGGTVALITVNWNENTANGRTLNVYGKSTAYSAPTDLYDNDLQGTLIGTIVYGTSTELEITDDYEFIGLRSSSGAMYLHDIYITWTTSGGIPQPTVATPTFSPAAGTYFEAQEVSINCTTEGATIHYTIDGTDPTESSLVYSSPIEITETTTVKAFAMKEGYINSGIASATYTIAESPDVITIAEARALALNEYALVQGVVTFIDGRNVYIQDETAGIDLYLNNNTVPSTLALGDMVQAYGKRAAYNGLAELSGIDGNNTEQFEILSSGNTLPLVVKTIAEILEGGADALQCTRVKVESATIGAINTSGNTPLTQDESSINIYKVPALTDIEEGDAVDVIAVIGYFNTAQLRVASADDVVLVETPVIPDPVLTVSVTELNDFRYIFGAGPSTAKNFTVSGTNLVSAVTLTAPQDYELSINPGNGYFDSDELSPVDGTLAETTIYVRLKANLAPGTYSGNLAIISGDHSYNVALNGMVDEIPSSLTVSPSALYDFEYEYETGGPSEIQFFTVGGDQLTHNVSILPSESFEVSTQPTALFHPENPAMIYIPNSGHFYGIKIYVRMKAGLEVGTYNELIAVASEDADTVFVSVTGVVTGDVPTPPDPPTPPTPGDGNYVRINDLSSLTAGSYVVFAARFDENATDYYAMTNQSSGKPTGVLFTSATADENEVLPASIVDEESSYYWIVGVTANGYTFTNAEGELIGYTSSTNFATGGDNTEWSIEAGTTGDEAMVPDYSGFLVTNVNNNVRHFALNSNHNFGPYHSNNFNNSGYNFYLDLFVKTEGGVPPTPTVATPTFSPAAGTYFEAQTVSITCATDGVTIYYTLDGTDPTESSPVYSTPIIIEETTTVKAIAMKEDYNNSNIAEATYTIQLGVVTIFNQDWEGEMNGWTFVDVMGEASWNVAQYSGNHYAYANGYNHGANEDWCISPAFNLNSYSNPILTFRTAKNYNGNDLEVYFSNDYDGEDPTEATWIQLTCALSPGSWTWTESGDIDLSSFSGSNCYIGFKYTCEEGSAAGWEVDDILLVGSTSNPVVTVSPMALMGFTYIEGNGPSAEQSFTVSGFNLSGNITITDAPDFEISLTSGDNFNAQSSITLTPVSGNVDTTIFVRMKAGLEVGEYNEEVIGINSEVDDYEVTCSGTVTAQPVPGDDYVRIHAVSELVAGNRVVFAARFDENTTDYYAMSNAASGKPEGVLFTSTTNEGDEILPASILNDEDNFYWTVGVTADGYTFTNAAGDMIGYTSSTNFSPNGDNTAWSIEIGTSEETAMVPNYTGFVIANVNNPVRAFALNSNHNFGPYHTQNMASENYNFFLDIFMQGEGGTCTVAAPTFDPAGGTYYEPQEVTISCATEGATIWYSLISWNGPWTPYTEAITVEEFASIWAYAEKEGCNDSPVVNATYIIQDDIVIIFNQDWEDDWNGWTEVCVYGDSLWRIASYQGNHYAYANGYNHPASEDWLISPAFDLDSYSDVVLTFRTAMNYNGPDIEVFFSNDYDGQDPTTATWEPLECELSQGGWNWVVSGDISLNAFNGSNCYIGFKYTCTDDEAAGWEVDDIMLTSGGISTDPYLIATPNTLSGMTHIVWQGPSLPLTFNLTGGNFLSPIGGSVVLTLSDNSAFEMSLDGEEYSTVIYIDIDENTTLDTTVYVRLWGGEVGQYSDSILIMEPDGFYIMVALNGQVLSENEPSIAWDDLPHYIQGNNGSNNNRVPVATYVRLQNLEPYTTYRYTNQFVDENDGPETAGAGNVIYANLDGFYRTTSPSLATEGGYGEFTTNWDGEADVWFVNEPTANARFTPGNHVYLRIRLNDGHDGTTVAQTFTTESYATVINFGTEHDANQGTAFYVKSNENPMTFAQMFTGYLDPQNPDTRPIFATIVETTGVDFGNINQYADFYKEEVAGKDGWFGGILPNDNEYGINKILVFDITHYWFQDYYAAEFNGQWYPDANTVNPTNGLDEPIFIDLTYDGVEEAAEGNIKVWGADHEFVIENGDNAHYTMTVYNVLGQPMMQQQINAGCTERIGHSLATGLYVISLQNNKNKVAVKVIVK
jgi:hypothetical protein